MPNKIFAKNSTYTVVVQALGGGGAFLFFELGVTQCYLLYMKYYSR